MAVVLHCYQGKKKELRAAGVHTRPIGHTSIKTIHWLMAPALLTLTWRLKPALYVAQRTNDMLSLNHFTQGKGDSGRRSNTL
jgi:hypothetical protein